MHLLSFSGGGHRPHFTVCSAALQREYLVELSTLKTPQHSQPRESLDIAVPISTPSTRAASYGQEWPRRFVGAVASNVW